MIYTLTNPAGIDAYIQEHQQYLYDELKATWDLSDDDITCYGRVRQIMAADGSGYEARYFNGNEPLDPYIDDTKKVVLFYAKSDNVQSLESFNKANVSIIVFMNLDAVYGEDAQQYDERARCEVGNISNKVQSFSQIGTVTSIAKVLSEFPASIKKLDKKFIDAPPYHCFKVNFNVLFQSGTFFSDPTIITQ